MNDTEQKTHEFRTPVVQEKVKEVPVRGLGEGDLTEAVLAKLANISDPRFKQTATSLVKHLHAFVREVELTED